MCPVSSGFNIPSLNLSNAAIVLVSVAVLLHRSFGFCTLLNGTLSWERTCNASFPLFYFPSFSPGSYSLSAIYIPNGFLIAPSSFSGTESCFSNTSPLVAVCYHLYELPLMRLSSEQTLAWERRRRGLEWGKCPHPSSQYRSLSGTQPLSAAGKHPGITDGGREREDGAELIYFLGFVYLNVCVFWSWLKLYHLWFFFVVWRHNCR